MSRFLNILVVTCVVYGFIQVPGLNSARRHESAEWPSLSNLEARAQRLVPAGVLAPGLAGLAAALGVVGARVLIRRVRRAARRSSLGNPEKPTQWRTNATVWVWET